MPEKAILIVCDGMSDRPFPKKTPLQSAKKKNIDLIAREGICGISDPISPGVPPGSDTAHLALLGFDPYKYYAGRGVLEALGSGLKLYPGDVAFRCNFATVDRKFRIIDRRAGRIEDKDAASLAYAIKHLKIAGFDFYFHHTVGHRGVLIIKKASSKVSDVDPHKIGEIEWAKPLVPSKEAKETADAINSWIKEVNKILSKHDVNVRRAREGKPVANVVIMRGASSLVEGTPHKGNAVYDGPHLKNSVTVPKFEEVYGLSAVCIAGGPLYKGVSRYLGMDVIDVRGATADLNTDLDAKFKAAVKA